ncbi:MAG: phosphocholine cytidylyltransferase family protein [Clostridiaceae bacterium]
MKAILLIAGIGSRLGQPYPKCLNKLPYGETIIQRQVRILRECGIEEIIAVCGFKKELVMEHMPNILYKYNPIYYITNTSKSLLTGIERLDDDIIWINGDVVFDKEIILSMIKSNKKNKIAVDNKNCGEEEIKYTLNSNNTIQEISKEVKNAQGEAVGINIISKEYLNIFRNNLIKCKDKDFFEKAIEYCIKEGMEFYPINIKDNRCVEVDFYEDWECACNLFNK